MTFGDAVRRAGRLGLSARSMRSLSALAISRSRLVTSLRKHRAISSRTRTGVVGGNKIASQADLEISGNSVADGGSRKRALRANIWSSTQTPRFSPLVDWPFQMLLFRSHVNGCPR